MKKHILLIVLIITGVLIFSIAPTLAVKPGTERLLVPSGDSTCANAFYGTCVEINGYTIKAYYEKEGELLEIYEADLKSGEWPTENADGTIEYKYWAGRTVAEDSPATPSYLILDLETFPEDIDVPGAAIDIDECGTYVFESSRIAYKLNPNPTLSATRDITFTITEPAGHSYDICSGNALIKFSDGCYAPIEKRLMMPDSDGQSPWVQKRRFECSTTIAMQVEYELCSGIPKTVWNEDKDNGLVEITDYVTLPWIYMEPSDPDDLTPRLDELKNVGPEQGTVLCTDDDYPVFLWKDRGYFSKPEPN